MSLRNNHDPIGMRLSVIISRLFLGERLSLSSLATEFNVSERTIRRDLEDRICGCLNIEKHKNFYCLSKTQLGTHKTDNDIIRFAKTTYMDRLFPSFDRRLVSVLGSDYLHSPFIIYTLPPKKEVSTFGSFLVLTEAIIRHRKLNFQVGMDHYKAYHPYRLIFINQQWYLTGLNGKKLQVFNYEELMNVEQCTATFEVNNNILQIINTEVFIQALPYFQYSVDLSQNVVEQLN